MRCLWLALIVTTGSVPAVWAQPAAVAGQQRDGSTATSAPDEPQVRAYFHDLARVESWSFFEPPPSGGDPSYGLFANRATLGVRVTTRRLDIDGAFQYAQLFGLSERLLGPGALGTGGLYYFSAQAPYAFQLYFRTLNLRVRNIMPGLSATIGRMGYSSGEETPSGDAFLDDLRRRRIGSRLIGEFEWSVFQRAFDGARLDFDRSKWAANGAVLFPTQGGYEESANPTIPALKIMSASFSLKPALLPHHHAQVFAYHYRDQRDVLARPDNALLGVQRADVSIATVGVSNVGSFRIGDGRADSVVWFAGQTGDWYGQDHGAFSFALEAGYQFDSAWRPWVRAGLVHASGDSDSLDTRHETFFQMVPSIDRYVQSTVYTLMNVHDAFAELSLEPHDRVKIRTQLHRVSLAEAADRWYYGSGATSRRAPFFGFATRPSGGAVELGTVLDSTVDVVLKPAWSVKGYLGWMKGGDVVRRSFVGDRMVFFYFENALRF